MDTLIIDLPWYEEHQDQMAQFKELSRVLYRDKDVVIIEFPRTDGNCRPEERGARRVIKLCDTGKGL